MSANQPFPVFPASRIHTELQARGHNPNNTGKYLCPFHAEKTPSFNLTEHDGKGHGRCFGCGWHGDVVDAVEQLDSLATREALERLGEGTGSPKQNTNEPTISSPTLDVPLPPKSESRPEYGPVFRWIVDTLPLDSMAEQYLTGHALTMEEARQFGLRAIPFKDTGPFLEKFRHAFPDELLMAFGVMGVGKKSGRLYFTMAGRLIVPWYGGDGRIVFIQGRSLNNKGAKWFSCGPVPSCLYIPGGQYPDALQSGQLWITEGAIDALALHVRRGLRAVGCYNASKTDLEPLARSMAAAHKAGRLPSVTLALDNDCPGQGLESRWVAALVTAGFPQARIEAWQEDGVKDIADFLALPAERKLIAERWAEIERTDPAVR